MFRDSCWFKVQNIPPVCRAAAKINILEPEREKRLLKSAQFLPRRTPDHEKGTGRLLHGQSPRVIQVQSAVAAIYRVSRPEPVKQESFQNQRGRGRKTADHETGLRMAVLADQEASAASSSGQAAGGAHGIEARGKNGIRIQEQHKIAFQGCNTLIYRGREASILRVRDDADRALTDSFEGMVS